MSADILVTLTLVAGATGWWVWRMVTEAVKTRQELETKRQDLTSRLDDLEKDFGESAVDQVRGLRRRLASANTAGVVALLSVEADRVRRLETQRQGPVRLLDDLEKNLGEGTADRTRKIRQQLMEADSVGALDRLAIEAEKVRKLETERQRLATLLDDLGKDFGEEAADRTRKIRQQLMEADSVGALDSLSQEVEKVRELETQRKRLTGLLDDFLAKNFGEKMIDRVREIRQQLTGADTIGVLRQLATEVERMRKLEEERQSLKGRLDDLGEEFGEETAGRVREIRQQLMVAETVGALRPLSEETEKVRELEAKRQDLMGQLGELEKNSGAGTVDCAREIRRQLALAGTVGELDSLARKAEPVRELEAKLSDLEKPQNRRTPDFARKVRKRLEGGVAPELIRSIASRVDLWWENRKTFETLGDLMSSGDRDLIRHASLLRQELTGAADLAGKQRRKEFRRIAMQANAWWMSMRGTSGYGQAFNWLDDMDDSDFGCGQGPDSGRDQANPDQVVEGTIYLQGPDSDRDQAGPAEVTLRIATKQGPDSDRGQADPTGAA